MERRQKALPQGGGWGRPCCRRRSRLGRGAGLPPHRWGFCIPRGATPLPRDVGGRPAGAQLGYYKDEEVHNLGINLDGGSAYDEGLRCFLETSEEGVQVRK